MELKPEMEKNNLIIAFNDFPNFDPYPESLLSIRHAAYRWKTHYYEVTNFISTPDFYHPNTDKAVPSFFWCLKNFLSYDKVLVLSPDMVVNSKAPNLFNEFDMLYSIGVVRDMDPKGRFNNVIFKNNITNHIAHSDECIYLFEKYIPSFDYQRYLDNYINWGMLIFNPKKIYYDSIELENIIKNNKEISNGFKNFMFSSNLFNAFFCSRNIQFLDFKWNWTIPNIAGKNGWVLDHFDPNTGELIDWESTSDYPPDWADNVFRGHMHPYIYHFCGTDNAKEICKTYDRWR